MRSFFCVQLRADLGQRTGQLVQTAQVCAQPASVLLRPYRHRQRGKFQAMADKRSARGLQFYLDLIDGSCGRLRLRLDFNHSTNINLIRISSHLLSATSNSSIIRAYLALMCSSLMRWRIQFLFADRLVKNRLPAIELQRVQQGTSCSNSGANLKYGNRRATDIGST